MKRLYIGIALIAAVVSVLVALLKASVSVTDTQEPIGGENNTILFVTSELYGLCNVHIATAYSLLTLHPDTVVHFASFPRLESRIASISTLAQQKNPTASRIIFHPLSGNPYADASLLTVGAGDSSIIHQPGWRGVESVCNGMKHSISPWTADDYYTVYTSVRNIINNVAPSAVVLDTFLNPAVDATRDLNRIHAILTPNVLSHLYPSTQSVLKLLWKYPGVGSGYPFPMPWELIPANIYSNLKFITCMLSMVDHGSRRSILKSKGLKNPLDILGLYKPDIPWITQTLPGAHLALDNMPSNVIRVGPINLAGVDDANARNAELLNWVRRAPTMLIILGSNFKFTAVQATMMLEAIQHVLHETEAQVLWKLAASGDAGDEIFQSLTGTHMLPRLRVEKWLELEPPTLLQIHSIVAVVHHGGAGLYHDALAGGVPQVILPQWIDLYDYAQLVEYLGIGIWGCREMSPNWTSSCLAAAFLRVLSERPEDRIMQQNARSFGEQAQTRRGRDIAAEEVANLAALSRHRAKADKGE